MLIGGLVMHQFISSSVVGLGSLIDGSKQSVWPLVREDEFRRIVKNAVNSELFYLQNDRTQSVSI